MQAEIPLGLFDIKVLPETEHEECIKLDSKDMPIGSAMETFDLSSKDGIQIEYKKTWEPRFQPEIVLGLLEIPLGPETVHEESECIFAGRAAAAADFAQCAGSVCQIHLLFVLELLLCILQWSHTHERQHWSIQDFWICRPNNFPKIALGGCSALSATARTAAGISSAKGWYTIT